LAPTKSPPAVWIADDMSGLVGRDDGKLRVAVEGRDVRGKLAVTPELITAPGHYRVSVDYQAQGAADYLGLVMFGAGEKLKLLSLLTPGDGQTKQDYSTVEISPGECGQPSTFFVFYEGKGRLSVARMSVQKLFK
jgi:hypothetical protein